MYKIFLSSLCLLLCACLGQGKSQNNKSNVTEEITKENYEIIEVPKELKEISGITFIKDSVVAAIEDEHGLLYFFNIHKKEILRKFEFAKDGDYEDLVRVDNKIYVVESNGTIFEINDFDSIQPQVERYKTPLDKKNNIESIAYDKANQSLLLAVKDHNLNRDDKNNVEKDIYQFSLRSKKLDKHPFYQIKIKDIEDSYKGSPLEEESKKFLKALGNKNLTEVIKPSAMAYHPLTGNLYVLSSINHIIVVLDKQGKFLKIVPFIGKEFRQPEGISFNSKGELYVSNEGRKDIGNIIKIKELDVK